METKNPKIGVGVIVMRSGKVLLGKRKGSHGAGSWSFPGGHLEFGESVFDCARREVKEETGLEVENLRVGPFTNDIFINEEKHYVTLYVLAESFSGDAKIEEPEKCEEWGWFSWDTLPQPLFTPVENLLKQKFSPFQ